VTTINCVSTSQRNQTKGWSVRMLGCKKRLGPEQKEKSTEGLKRKVKNENCMGIRTGVEGESKPRDGWSGRWKKGVIR